ncbi:MAG: glycosyltransferase, partial [Sediminibacterium sp.]|nr:glycosyltransferase [Sediminibacterium sp.]
VLRHAQAVARRLSKNPEFDPILTVFYFPLQKSIKDVPNPNANADLNWRYIHSDNIFSISKSTVYRSHVPASNGFYESSAAESVENHNIQGEEIELIWTPIMQFSGVLSKPLNAIWYWLVVFAVLVNHYRKNADKESYLHLHAGDKIAWPLGFVKKHIWSKAFFWYTEHWAIFGKEIEDSYSKRSVFFRWYMKRIWKLADVSASISVFTHQQLQHTYKLPKRMHLFRNPVDTSMFNSRPGTNHNNLNLFSTLFPDIQIQQETINWLHVSNYDNRKQVPLIINAFNQISASNKDTPMNLILVGGDASELLAKNPEIDIDSVKSNPRIKIVGKVNPMELSDLMKMCSALILFSTAENAPCIIAEAQCCGLPIITSSVAGIPEMIVSSGVWFTKGLNEEHLKETMEQYLTEIKLESSAYSSSNPAVFKEGNIVSQMDVSEIAMARFNPQNIGQEILSAYLRYTPYQ